MSSFSFPLCCTCHMPDYLPISFVCQGDTHRSTHTSFLYTVCMAFILLGNSVFALFSPLFPSYLLYLTFPLPLFFSLSHHFSVLSHFLSSFLSQLTSLFLAPRACSLSVPPFIFLPSSLKNHPLAVWQEIRMYTCNEKV